MSKAVERGNQIRNAFACLFVSRTPERPTDREHAVDSLVSSNESSRISNALGLLRQRRLMIDGQTHRLLVAREDGARVADVRCE